MNKFGSGSRNLGDLLYLMNGESALKSSVLHPPPEYMLQQESHKGRLIQWKPLPARNPTDKVHYIVRFRDWRLTHSVTLALDVPKTGRVNSIIDACWHSSPPSPFRTYLKENPVLLGHE